MFRPEEQRPMNSQFAVRLAVLSGIALVAFAAIFFRLWYVQVLSGKEYLKQAEDNRVRTVTIQAPRGEILDRNGKVLVGNRSALSLQVRADQLPKDKQARNKELRLLSRVADMPYARIKREIREQTKLLPANPVTLARDVPRNLVFYLRERADEFPGVTAEQISVRDYPNGTLGAPLFGFVAEIGPDQLKEPQYKKLSPGDQIGASGLEQTYDSVLRGRKGEIKIPVDASGHPKGNQISEVQPEKGDNLVLTIDKKVQAAGEQAIQTYGNGNPGAFVVMDVNDGSILGMGSYPTFDPSIYTPPVSSKTITALNEDPADPLLDRAIQALYPTGSTFKLITATAGLETGAITATTPFSDTGTFDYAGLTWRNAGDSAYGLINMTSALKVSSDLYFYRLGEALDKMKGEPLQAWAANYGFGSDTGIDLPGEAPGRVPTPEWRNKAYEKAIQPDSPCGKDIVFDPARNCYEFADRLWGIGDNMNLAVGQGDLEATPLQLAVAYATLANGGDVVRPHLAMESEDPLGRIQQEFSPAPGRHVDISPGTISTITEGLREAAQEPGGTSQPVFGGYPVSVCGKTGTAEHSGYEDQAWYASFAPCDDPKYVVVTTIEQGGFGATTAAPAARDIYNQLFDVHGAGASSPSTTSAPAE